VSKMWSIQWLLFAARTDEKGEYFIFSFLQNLT